MEALWPWHYEGRWRPCELQLRRTPLRFIPLIASHCEPIIRRNVITHGSGSGGGGGSGGRGACIQLQSYRYDVAVGKGAVRMT